MDRLPDEGFLVAVEGMFLATGGCAANVAVDIAKQGVRVAAAGKVGTDFWGRFVREDLEQQGVDTRAVSESGEQQTSQTMILLCNGQDRRFVHTFGANRAFQVGDIPLDLLVSAKVMYVGGYLVLPAFDPVELAALFGKCREAGVTTVLDVVIPAGFAYRGELDPVLPVTDVFLPNDDEGVLLTGLVDPVQQAQAFRRMGARTVVVTLGAEGLLAAEGDRAWRAAPFPSQVVDQSGAGDAFCAGFITGLVHGLDLFGCLHYGSALGASCVTQMGCSAGVFTAPEASQFLAANVLEISPLTLGLVP
jgi:sugar/nucleoside kinase (ribokinase family)